MADNLEQQPVVLEDDSANRYGMSTAQPFIVQLSDGTDLSAIDGSGNLNVILAANSGVDIGDVDVTSVIPGTGATNLGKAEDAAHTSGDVGVMGLFVRQSTQADFGADGDYVPGSVDDNGGLRVSIVAGGGTGGTSCVDGAAFTVNTDSVSPAGYYYNDTTPGAIDEGDCGISRMTGNRVLLNTIVDPTTDANRWAIDGSGNGQVDLAAVSVTAVPVSKDGSANAETNPIFVQVVNGVVSGTEVHDYDTAAAVAKGATSNHDYTVTGTTFLLHSVEFASSGAMKAEIQTGPLAGLTTVAVGFTSSATPMNQIDFDPPVEVPATGTGTVRVIRTNRNRAQDLYSTIIGNDV